MIGYTGISGWKTLDEEMRNGVRELPGLSTKYPSKEVLVGADANFFFASWNYDMKVGGEVTSETLAPFGIKVFELTESCSHVIERNKSSIDDMYAYIINLGAIVNVEEKATSLADKYKTDLAALTPSVENDKSLRVFVCDSSQGSPFTAGRYAMPKALIEAAGGQNIMDDFEKS